MRSRAGRPRVYRMPLRPGSAPDLMRAIETLMRPSRTDSACFEPLGVYQTRSRVSATREPPSVENGAFSSCAFLTVM